MSCQFPSLQGMAYTSVEPVQIGSSHCHFTLLPCSICENWSKHQTQIVSGQRPLKELLGKSTKIPQNADPTFKHLPIQKFPSNQAQTPSGKSSLTGICPEMRPRDVKGSRDQMCFCWLMKLGCPNKSSAAIIIIISSLSLSISLIVCFLLFLHGLAKNPVLLNQK